MARSFLLCVLLAASLSAAFATCPTNLATYAPLFVGTWCTNLSGAAGQQSTWTSTASNTVTVASTTFTFTSFSSCSATTQGGRACFGTATVGIITYQTVVEYLDATCGSSTPAAVSMTFNLNQKPYMFVGTPGACPSSAGFVATATGLAIATGAMGFLLA